MITVIAGVNGAGKSSIPGARIEAAGGQYFNPDVYARKLQQRDPSISLAAANSQAWKMGFEQLKRSIKLDDDYAFETTLGGNSIVQALIEAGQRGRKIQVFYCGLNSPELHIERVAIRVARGGHSIPEQTIRERWKSSILNMMALIPVCHRVQIWDNSIPADEAGPHPVRLMSFTEGKFDPGGEPSRELPAWAKPLAAAALKAGVSLDK
jgi:predicted ABC-type ATPase